MKQFKKVLLASALFVALMAMSGGAWAQSAQKQQPNRERKQLETSIVSDEASLIDGKYVTEKQSKQEELLKEQTAKMAKLGKSAKNVTNQRKTFIFNGQPKTK